MSRFLQSLDLSGRTRNALIAAGEGTTEETFLAVTKRQFLSLQGGGEKGWREVEIAQEQIRGEFSDGGWATMTSCPFVTPVDLWCVCGNETFAQLDGGWPVGELVTNRSRHPQYQFFGIENLAHVPDAGGDVDLIPVAWRLAAPPCPPQLIAQVRGLPMTQAEVMEANGDAGAA